MHPRILLYFSFVPYAYFIFSKCDSSANDLRNYFTDRSDIVILGNEGDKLYFFYLIYCFHMLISC